MERLALTSYRVIRPTTTPPRWLGPAVEAVVWLAFVATVLAWAGAL